MSNLQYIFYKNLDMIKFLILPMGIFSILLLILNPISLFTLWLTFILIFPSYFYFNQNKIGLGTVLFFIGIILSALINNLFLPYISKIL